AYEHVHSVIRANPGTRERGAIGEYVERDVIRVRPDAHLRIIGKAVSVRKRVPIVRAGRIAGRRHGDALQVRGGGDRELRNDPAIRDRIVQDSRIAVIVRLAASAKTAPQGVDGDGTV